MSMLRILAVFGLLFGITSVNSILAGINPSEPSINVEDNPNESNSVVENTNSELKSCSYDCNKSGSRNTNSVSPPEHCTSHYGGFPGLDDKIRVLASQHLTKSMQFLMLSARFAGWKSQRNGLKKYFEYLSDEAFMEAGSMIKQMAKRGGKLNSFTIDIPTDNTYNTLTELEALTKALDLQKDLGKNTLDLMHTISEGVTVGGKIYQDGQFAHFLAEEIGEKHTNEIRKLAGHVNVLGNAILSINADRTATNTHKTATGFAIHMFDTYVLEK